MSEVSEPIDYKSYDSKQISIFQTSLMTPPYLIKSILGIALFILSAFLSLGILYIYIYPLLTFSLFVFFEIIAVMKSRSCPVEFGNKLAFYPIGDESKISRYFYTAYLSEVFSVILFNLEFLRRPQLLDVFGYYLIFLMNWIFFITIFLASKMIIESHQIRIQKDKNMLEPNEHNSKEIILGVSVSHAMKWWYSTLIITFIGGGMFLLGLFIFMFAFTEFSRSFFTIAVSIDRYYSVLFLDYFSIALIPFSFIFFVSLVVFFYNSMSIIRTNLPLILEKYEPKSMNEKIIIRGLELLIVEK